MRKASAAPSNAKKAEKKSQLSATAAVVASVIAAAPIHRVPPMEDTEALILDTIECLLDETFLFHIQCDRLAKQMHFGIEAMASSIIATLRMGCYIDYDAVVVVDPSEDEPSADSVDRHAVQALPKKAISAHPQRLYECPNGAPIQRATSIRSMSEKSLPPRNAAAGGTGPTLARRKGSTSSDALHLQEQPMVFRIPAKVDYFDKETKAWRIKCMTELASSKQKKAKWGKVSVLRRALGQREYDVTETSVVSEPVVGDHEGGAPDMTIDDAPVTTLDTVRTIPDESVSSQDPLLLLLSSPSNTKDKDSVPSRLPQSDDKPARFRRRYATGADGKSPKKAAPVTKSSWFYEKASLKGELKQDKAAAYQPHVMEFQRETFAQTIELNPGVSLVQGNAKFLGPHRRENMAAMSRLGFQNHLRNVVAASSDPSSSVVWDGPNKVVLRSLTLPNMPDPATALQDDILHNSKSTTELRPPHPSLHPPQNGTLTCDTTNTRTTPTLTHPSDKNVSVRFKSASPAVRVRVSPLRADTPNARPQPRDQYVTHGDSVGVLEIPSHRRRPSTAIGALLVNAPSSSTTSTSSSTKATSKLKYIREFPPPKAEVVTVLKPADDRHRMAWLS
ncbi:hypothetical protein H310_06909 [Aphanomyces invadans]|uniref:Uncharacterized protein n=1 Tax=Aphanomyces invadans TaxID=157072 RepID=A0A024U4M5_9STRA|nr:hypothetical protein H310_06909 [Aphanomyces invadans]ETW01351.1 hypothetical protein H310_06909 [Aphanomyces invadans]|eukprot:XP_008870349.1 hypothetical protein H310_06909 [Aphanomyces invadans]